MEASKSFGAVSLDRDALSEQIGRGIGDHAVSQFHSPPPARFAKGVGTVAMAEFMASADRRAIFHTRVVRDDGHRTDVVLFGSVDNLPDFIAIDDLFSSGWTSSAAKSIEIFLRSGDNTWDESDEGDEALAREALKVALRQGTSKVSDADLSRPQLRSFTIGHAEDVEWFAEVHLDVEIDPDRWMPDPNEAMNTERIIIGAPLWIRTPRPEAVELYNLRRRAEGLPLEPLPRRGQRGRRRRWRLLWR